MVTFLGVGEKCSEDFQEKRYIEYITTTLILIANMGRGRNKNIIGLLETLGLSEELIVSSF